MGPPKKIDSANDFSIETLGIEVLKLTKLVSKLQSNQKNLLKSIKEMKKSIESLANITKQHSESIENLIVPANARISISRIPLSEKDPGERLKIDRDHFVPALYQLLSDLKPSNQKGYIDIKTVKTEFLRRYYLEDEKEFEKWLLESYWSNEIELISGIGDYSIRDIYDNVYHNIKC